MTTFIDFRYSRALNSAMFTGEQREEEALRLAPDGPGHLALELAEPAAAGPLLSLRAPDGQLAAVLVLEEGHLVLRTSGPPLRVPFGGGRPFALRAGGRTTGLRGDGAVNEVPFSIFPGGQPVDVELGAARLLGRGSGRAFAWAELFYRRPEPRGPTVELAMDWHHLRAGIPLQGTMMAEQLVAGGRHRLKLRSYAHDVPESQTTDFARLFASPGTTDVAMHLSPPLYARQVAGVPNVAFGVVESASVQPDVIDRYQAMDVITVPSRFVARAFRKSGARPPIRVVPHGVDIDFYRPVPGPRSLPGGRTFNFLAVGTHVNRKNMEAIVQAFLEEFRERDDVALFLLLRPEYKTSQQNVALDFAAWERTHLRPESAPIFLWTGYLTRERLRDFYAGASAYVMPSNEGFGLTLLEAMACGTPVIGLDHGGVRDFLDERTGYLVRTKGSFVDRDMDLLPYVGDRFLRPDIAHLRAQMRRVLDHPDEAAERAAAGRRTCEARFTWDEVGRGLARILDEVHAAAPRARSVAAPRPSITWVLCVLDDEPAAAALRRLRRRRDAGSRVLCLFTRYGLVPDVIRARRHGFLFYSWDGTEESALIVARGVLGEGWIGLVRPGEEIAGDEAELRRWLAAQPASVSAATVAGGEGPRLVRLGAAPGATSRCDVITIGG